MHTLYSKRKVIKCVMKWRYCIKLLVCRFPFLCYEYKLIDKQKLSERDSSDSKNTSEVTVNRLTLKVWKALQNLALQDVTVEIKASFTVNISKLLQKPNQRTCGDLWALVFSRVSLAKPKGNPTQAICEPLWAMFKIKSACASRTQRFEQLCTFHNSAARAITTKAKYFIAS